jgi:hypothetical protein
LTAARQPNLARVRGRTWGWAIAFARVSHARISLRRLADTGVARARVAHRSVGFLAGFFRPCVFGPGGFGRGSFGDPIANHRDLSGSQRLPGWGWHSFPESADARAFDLGHHEATGWISGDDADDVRANAVIEAALVHPGCANFLGAREIHPVRLRRGVVAAGGRTVGDDDGGDTL